MKAYSRMGEIKPYDIFNESLVCAGLFYDLFYIEAFLRVFEYQTYIG